MGIKVRLTVAVSSVAVATALTGALGATPAASTSAAPGAVTTTSSPATTTTTPDRYTAGRYIVTFADEPVASYSGYESRVPRHATQARAAPRPRFDRGAEVAGPPDRQARPGTGPGRCHEDLRLHGRQQRRRREAERPAGLRAGQGPGRRRPEQGPEDQAHHHGLPALPRPRRRWRHLVPAGRTRQRGRRCGRRCDRQRHLAREHRLRRRDRHPGPRRLARQMRVRRAVRQEPGVQ